MIILRKIRRWSSLTVNFDSLVLLAPLYDREVLFAAMLSRARIVSPSVDLRNCRLISTGTEDPDFTSGK